MASFRASIVPNLDTDWLLRLAAFARLRPLRDPNGSTEATAIYLAGGFEFEGDRIGCHSSVQSG